MEIITKIKIYNLKKDKLDLTTPGWKDYELLDSGNRRKLERFGEILLIRFEPEASWKPHLKISEWNRAHAEFTLEPGARRGKWTILKPIPDSWIIKIDKFRIRMSITASRHLGIFPEQLPNWLWLRHAIIGLDFMPKVLNLFAYTGIATLFAADAGAEITHVDASKNAVLQASNNMRTSGMPDAPVRWIVDDVLKYVRREIRRGSRYDAIVMDPPLFGRGPGGEVWKFEKNISDLIYACMRLLNPDPLFFICTAYNIKMESNELADLFDFPNTSGTVLIEHGNIIQKEKSAGRMIQQAKFVRWKRANKE